MVEPASASPDTFIDFAEEPIAVSKEHLFLLRASTDNLGYDEASRVEVYFVQVDWITVGYDGMHRISRTAIQDGLEAQKAFFIANASKHPRSSTMTTRQHLEERAISAGQCASAGIYDY